MRGNLYRRLEDLEARNEPVEQPLHSKAWPRVVAYLDRRAAISQGAETTPEEIAELEAFEDAMRAEIAKRRAEGRM